MRLQLFFILLLLSACSPREYEFKGQLTLAPNSAYNVPTLDSVKRHLRKIDPSILSLLPPVAPAKFHFHYLSDSALEGGLEVFDTNSPKSNRWTFQTRQYYKSIGGGGFAGPLTLIDSSLPLHFSLITISLGPDASGPLGHQAWLSPTLRSIDFSHQVDLDSFYSLHLFNERDEFVLDSLHNAHKKLNKKP
jgi:hypothetical protein